MLRRVREGGSLEDALTGRARTAQSRLLVGALALLALLVTLASVFVWQQYRDAKREAVGELHARAVLAATVFDTYFNGQLQTLSAVAASTAVVTRDTERMRTYFSRFRPGSGTTFTAGVGWIDAGGRQRATSDPRGPIAGSFRRRSYFSHVMATGKPFVSEAIVGRESKRRLLVMAVPTRDARGKLTGVLAGGIVLRASREDARSIDLGYSGLSVIDRTGQQITRADLAHPENRDLLREMRTRREGTLSDTRGLDGSAGRVVAFATAVRAGWTTVLDQPASVVFADARRALALEVALIGAAALVVALLALWASRRARRHLRESSDQVARWAGFTASLNETATVEEVGRALGRALVAEYPDAAAIVRTRADGSVEPPAPTVFAGQRSTLHLSSNDDVRGTTSLVEASSAAVALETVEELRLHDELQAVHAAGARALYGFPFTGPEGRAGGAAVVLFTRQRALGGDHATLVQAYVDQAAQALDRVRRHQHEHDTAVLLQRSLLPATLDAADGVEAASHYRAGALDTQVGGDWFDVVNRPDGIVHLTVGDVAGRGIDAAVSMGELRTASRAYALEHASPAAVIGRLARHVREDEMATVVCVAYDPYTRELAYASAGHLPPLLVDHAAGAASRLDRSASAPLGWAEHVGTEDTRAVVPPDATLALYTDGLVERRGESPDEGIERLVAAVLQTVGLPAAEAVDTIVDMMVEPDPADDLALLLVRLENAPSRLRVELPAEPSVLRGLRRRVRTWLELRGFDEDARADAVLALNEACANAIEHGYQGGAGTIAVQLEHSSERLAISVADEGTWREPQPDSARGRGFVIMRNVMDTTEVVHRPTGTTVVLEREL